MKVLALEIEKQGTASKNFSPFLKEEAAKVWELQQKDSIREIYFNAATHCAVIILETSSQSSAEGILEQIPLVREGLITFDLIPLVPYNGYARLFE